MTIVRSYLVLAGVGLAALALCIGSVAAKPAFPDKPAPKLKGLNLSGVDPALAKQLAPRAVDKGELLELQKKAAPEAFKPAFNLKRLEPLARAKILGAAEPAALPGPRVFDARTHYHDDTTYMDLFGYNAGHVGVRPKANYIHFLGDDRVVSSPFLRPSAEIHFTAAPDTRYLLECAVDTAGPGATFYASDDRGEYSVNSNDRATLLYLRNQAGVAEEVTVRISASSTSWYIDRCELTASKR